MIETKVIPWEDTRDLNFGKRLINTWLFIILRPLDFFSKLHLYKGKKNPLFFGMIILGIGIFLHLLISLTFGFEVLSRDLAKMDMVVKRQDLIFSGLFAILFLCLSYVVISYIFSGLLHTMIYALVGKKDFDLTFRIVSYCWAVTIFSILPFLGGVISGILYLTLIAMGIKIIHRLNWTQVVITLIGGCISFVLLTLLVSSIISR